MSMDCKEFTSFFFNPRLISCISQIQLFQLKEGKKKHKMLDGLEILVAREFRNNTEENI